ncbi:MAG: hypothetical protein OES24_07160, partial [Acidimicrobiia bacterium]|nr:hypothetical protein [Acidimicrobiia bacterium]
VPVTIDVVETGTAIAVGYEQTDKPSEIDVHPSGFSFTSSSDLDTTTFLDTEIDFRAYALYDSESGTLHNRQRQLPVRGGHTVTVEPTSSDPTVGTVVAAAVFTGGINTAPAMFDGLAAGTTILEIVQPAGHTPPANGHTTRTVNVTAPDVYVEEFRGCGSFGCSYVYSQPLVVGFDLQFAAVVRFEVKPPTAVDVIVSVPAGSGVLLSASPTEAGSESIVVDTAVTSIRTSLFYVQGTIEGDDVDDDVPVTIDVVETGTAIAVGYEQTDKPSEIDVHPSGFSFTSSSDLTTTSFSPDVNVPLRAYALYDSESGTLHNRQRQLPVRGGHTVTVEPTSSDPTVGTVVAAAVFASGDDTANAILDPLTAGTTTLGIVQPPGHIPPANGYTTRNVVVDAPDVWLYESSPSTRITDEIIGRDLQVERRIRLEVVPPAPGVDVTIDVIGPTVAVISTDPTAAGSESITFPLVTGTSTPLIYVQGLALDQGTELRITAPGYDQWITTIQVVDSGFAIYTPGDFTTTTTASNRTIQVRPASLDVLQRVDEWQMVRGGTTPSVDVSSSAPTVGVITISPLVFTGDLDYVNTQFDPLAVGSTTISITQPPGFLPPSGRTSIMATVEPG